MSINTIKIKISGITDGGLNTAFEMRDVLTDITDTFSGATDSNKIKVSSNDTTSGFLEDKLLKGDGIISSTINDGGNEQLELSLGKHYLSLASTGLYTGALLSVGGPIGTFDIAAGEGLFIDSTTDFNDIVVSGITITPKTGITVTNILTQPVTYVSIDMNDNVIQSITFPNSSERRNNIFLGAVVHSDNVNVNVVNNLPTVAPDVLNQVYDRWNAEGDYFNISGNIFSGSSNNLNIDLSGGQVFKTSSNFENDITNPHIKTFSGQTALTFRYRLQDSSEESNTINIDPNNYDVAGVKTVVPPNKYTIQRITIFSSTNNGVVAAIRVQYGQNLYDSLEDAKANVALEPFVTESNIGENGLLRCHLILEQGTTDLSDIFDAEFVEAARSGKPKETNVGGNVFRTGILNDSSTGLRDGGTLSINGDNTKFDVASGHGRVIDNSTDSNSPILKEVNWSGFTAENLPDIATGLITFIAINSAGDLIKQTTEFNTQEYRDCIVLGRIGHINNTTVTSVTNLSVPFVDPLLTTVDLAQSVGNINTSGNVFSFQGGNLKIDKSAGTQFRFGSNKYLDDKNPHISSQTQLSGVTFLPVYRDGAGGVTLGALTDVIDPNQWDDGSGTLQTVSGNLTIQRLFHFSSNIVVVAYGQQTYNTMDLAISGLFTDPFEIFGPTGSINRSAIIIKDNVTDLTLDANKSRIIESSKFGEFTGGAGGGGSTASLQVAYNNSVPNPELITTSTNGALTIRRGSTLDTDNVYEGQNGAGSTTFNVTGEGRVVTSGITNDMISSGNSRTLITKEYGDANYAGGGDVTKVGTPVNNEIGVWTGDGTIEGTGNLQFASGELWVTPDNFVNAANIAHNAIGTYNSAGAQVYMTPTSVQLKNTSAAITASISDNSVQVGVAGNGMQLTNDALIFDSTAGTGTLSFTADTGAIGNSTFNINVPVATGTLALTSDIDVTKVGTPVNLQVGVWTGDGTIKGDSGLIYSSNQLFIGEFNFARGLVRVRGDSVGGGTVWIDQETGHTGVDSAYLMKALLGEFIIEGGAGSNILRYTSSSGNLDFGATTLQASNYGGGTIIGTPTYTLNVDVNGNIIEGTVANVSKTGTPVGNSVALWFGDGVLRHDDEVRMLGIGGGNGSSRSLILGSSDSINGILELHGNTGASGGLISLYNGASGDSDHDRYIIRAQSGVFEMKGLNDLFLSYTSSTQIVNIPTPLIVSSGYTVATLPTGAVGMRAYITDALTPTYHGIAVGGGAITCSVFHDGTNWIT